MEYQIEVLGTLDPSWCEWLGGLALSHETFPDGHTASTLNGEIADQASLRGVLVRLWDLNLTILLVQAQYCQQE